MNQSERNKLDFKSPSLLLKNGYVISMADSDSTAEPCICDILIEDGLIKKIAQNIVPLLSSTNSYKDSPSCDIKVIDLMGKTILPGFIEAHCHIGITEERKGCAGDDCNETTNPITPWIRALDAVNPLDSAFSKAVAAGITSVMVGPGSSNVVGGQFLFMKTAGSRCIDELVIKEPAAMKAAFGENPKNAYGNSNQTMPGSRMAIAGMLREELTHARDYWYRKEQARRRNEHFEEDYRLECWLPVFSKQIPLKCHVHRADDIFTAIRIAKEFDLDITLDHCTEGHLIAREIMNTGYPCILGPDLTSRNKIEVENMTFKTVGILNHAGVLTAITTDHPVSLIDSLPYCAGMAAKKGLGQTEALKAITINAAKICRTDKRVGSIEPGKDADIAVFDGNPLEISTHCIMTIINGIIVYQYEADKNAAV